MKHLDEIYAAAPADLLPAEFLLALVESPKRFAEHLGKVRDADEKQAWADLLNHALVSLLVLGDARDPYFKPQHPSEYSVRWHESAGFPSVCIIGFPSGLEKLSQYASDIWRIAYERRCSLVSELRYLGDPTGFSKADWLDGR